ncbi:MAG: F0F1 ATP synthase subunit delta [Coriobacteriia bacterium]|nr:F0F1 ATP synthase subunit delta [Coriobacteriia bacterium]MCL2745867.1 F0F1 ATP synthase subunit delta [Coriobacteriia bacterium]MCL2870292.1 F0F1 ATP synthase subunit delta [Coriobacteriia bacterium]
MTSASGKDVLVVSVVTATPLSDDARTKIVEKLTKELSQPVQLEERVAPSVLGGLRLQFGDYLYDATVAGQLKDIQVALQKAGEEGR